MRYLIGVDEAGYGPNLGPLVITTTTWKLSRRCPTDDLYAALDDAIVPPHVRRDADDARVVLGDSKQVFAGKNLAALERGVLAALAVTRQKIATWRCLWSALCPEDDPCRAADLSRPADPWHADFNVSLPLAARRVDVRDGARRLRQVGEACGARLIAVRCRAIFPERFNELVAQFDSKAAALSALTLGLIGQALAPLPAAPVRILGDKHGGRNQYHALLQQEFPDALIEVYRETAEESLYRWGPPERRVEACFRPRGEEQLPTALASMVSKYVREMAMHAFNEFWRRHVPELRPTAGYHVDALRFKNDIARAQTALAIPDGLLWRVR